MNNDPNDAASKNHSDNAMPEAAPPATVRSRKPEAMIAMSITGSSFSARQ